MRYILRSASTSLVLILVVALMWGQGAPDAPDDSGDSNPTHISELSFLAGSWVSENGSRRLEEHWTIPAGGTMIGMNRMVIGERTASYEYLRIERTEDGIDYVAIPIRQSLTRFRLIECAGDRVVFENPDHDFPNRIIYERSGDKLIGRIEGMRGGKEASAQWEWIRGTIGGE